MLFPKEYLESEVKQKAKNEAKMSFPYKTFTQGNDGSTPTMFELLNLNLATFFDFKSDEMKLLMHKSRSEISENCFNADTLNEFYVNEKQIDNCIHNSYAKHLGKYEKAKWQYFYNSKLG